MTREHWEIYAILRNIDRNKADEYKRKIRVKHCRVITQDDGWNVAYSNDDSITYKRFFQGHFTENEWEDFCEDTEVRIYSPYDCTGRMFTVSLEKYRVSNGTWVYHKMAMDI